MTDFFIWNALLSIMLDNFVHTIVVSRKFNRVTVVMVSPALLKLFDAKFDKIISYMCSHISWEPIHLISYISIAH